MEGRIGNIFMRKTLQPNWSRFYKAKVPTIGIVADLHSERWKQSQAGVFDLIKGDDARRMFELAGEQGMRFVAVAGRLYKNEGAVCAMCADEMQATTAALVANAKMADKGSDYTMWMAFGDKPFMNTMCEALREGN